MRRLSLIVGFLVFFTHSEAYGREEAQYQASTVIAKQIVSAWVVNKSKSTLAFSGIQNGEAFTGTFADFDAVIDFDPNDLANAKVVVTINMNSADADDVERNNALPSKEWFNIRKFPIAKFEAIDFTYLENDRYAAKGDLSIKGITQSISFPFTLKIENGYARMDSKIKLNRTAYKIGTGMWASKDWVEHSIDVDVHLEAMQSK